MYIYVLLFFTCMLFIHNVSNSTSKWHTAFGDSWHFFPHLQGGCNEHIRTSSKLSSYSALSLSHPLLLLHGTHSSIASLTHFIEHVSYPLHRRTGSQPSNPSYLETSATHLTSTITNSKPPMTRTTRVFSDSSNCSEEPPSVPQRQRPWPFLTTQASKRIQKWSTRRFGKPGKSGDWPFWLLNGERDGAAVMKKRVI